jgi:hypothetical protein
MKKIEHIVLHNGHTLLRAGALNVQDNELAQSGFYWHSDEAWLPVFASLTFLLPAFLAACRKQWGLVGLLLTVAFIPSAQLAIPSEARVFHDVLSYGWYLCSHLCVVHLALGILGPMDPNLKLLTLRSETWIPHLQLLVRAPVLAVLWANQKQWTPAVFARINVVVDEVFIVIGFVLFWLIAGSERRTLMRKVLLRAHFCHRLLGLVLPMISLIVLAALQPRFSQAAGYRMQADAALRVAAAILASLPVVGVLNGEPLPVEGDSPCAEWVLWGCAVTMAPVSIIAVLIDAWENPYRWPATLSTAATSPMGNFVLTVAALPLAVLAWAAIAIIDTVQPANSAISIATARGWSSQTVRTCHMIACVCGRIGIFMGLAAVIVSEKDKLGQIWHIGLAMGMFASYWAMMLFSALGTNLSSWSGQLRLILAICITFGLIFHLALFLVVNHYIHPEFVVPRSLDIMFAFSEYFQLCLIMCYPITWIREVISWQSHDNSVDDLLFSGKR